MPVRAATAADLPAILEIYNEAVLNTTATYDYEPQTLEQRRAWFDRLHGGGYPVVVSVAAPEQVLGWGALNPFNPKPGYRFTVENSVYIKAASRGNGLGTEILRALIELGQERRFHSIVALIDSNSVASLRMHQAQGFEKVGHIKQAGHKFGAWLDVVYLQRMLEEKLVSAAHPRQQG